MLGVNWQFSFPQNEVYVSPPLTWTRVERTLPYTLLASHLIKVSCRSLLHLSGEKGKKWRDPLLRADRSPWWWERGVPSCVFQETAGGGSPDTGQSRRPPDLLEKVKVEGRGRSN